ncbi:MAG: CCA tRNA nucleotidyltransferase [Alphaproteobacteria bacterium]|nr:CCA tRNA nucleotidyltransferase [Alphaproteobacteria bacterium]
MMELWDTKAQFLYNVLNGQVRLVGGCVRDYLLKKDFTDRDMATPLTPNQVIQLLEQHHISHVDIGKDFGTIIAKVNGTPFEITTLRKDIKTDGRHAVVAWTKLWHVDAKRRDFTINALYADKDGKIWDYVGGIRDLQQKQLRFIGKAEQRIKEDYLRILRYFRFFALMDLKEIPADILAAIQNNKQGLTQLSMDRRRDEMFKILTAPHPERTLKIMQQAELLTPALTQIIFSKKQKQYFQIHKMEKMLATFQFLV